MLRKYVGHDFTHLNKSSRKFSVVKQKKQAYDNKIWDFCDFLMKSFLAVKKNADKNHHIVPILQIILDQIILYNEVNDAI